LARVAVSFFIGVCEFAKFLHRDVEGRGDALEVAPGWVGVAALD
jgi:hypothetical protein